MVYFIPYSYGTKRKVDGNCGSSYCPNCRHTADKVLLREISFFNLLYVIPLFRRTKTRGRMCVVCGEVFPMTTGDYNNEKNALKNMQ